MLESVRSLLSGKTLFILVTLLAIPFVFFGSTSFGTVFTTYGSVNGESVTQRDVDFASSSIMQRYRNIFGEEFSIEDIGEEQFRESVKQEIINQKIMLSATKSSGLYASENQAKREIVKIENFQVDGKFDEGIFQSAIRANGFTPEDYINLVRDSISIDFYVQAVTNSTISLDSNIKDFILAYEKTRDLDFIHIDFESIKLNQEVNDDEIKDFYTANPLFFIDQERRSIKYVSLKLEDFKENIQLDEKDIKLAYEEYLSEQASNVQRRASHIMIDVQNYDNKDAAFAIIDAINLQLLNQEISFEEAVAIYSQDDATLEAAGDLGYSAGFAFPDEFETTLSQLSINDISGVIDLGDSLHILKLTELVEPEIKSFDESADELSQQYIMEESSQKLQSAVAEYEQRILSGESFDSIFKNSSIESYERIVPSDLPDNLASEVFKNNTLTNSISFVEFDNQAIFYEVTDIIEPEVLPFDAVTNLARDELLNTKARQAIEVLNNKILGIGLSQDIDGFETFKQVSRNSSLLPREVSRKLFSMQLNTQDKINLTNGDLYWIRPTAEYLPDDDAFEDKGDSYKVIVNQIEEQRMNNYIDSLLRADLRVNLQNL